MPEQFPLADAAAQLILKRTTLRPQIALVLGSGLGGFADSLTDATRVPYSDIPSFPPRPTHLVRPRRFHGPRRRHRAQSRIPRAHLRRLFRKRGPRRPASPA